MTIDWTDELKNLRAPHAIGQIITLLPDGLFLGCRTKIETFLENCKQHEEFCGLESVKFRNATYFLRLNSRKKGQN
jgi:hypothetical protein